MVTGTRKQLQAAIDKSARLGGAARARWLGGFAYEVTGEHGVYRVYWQGDNARCGCVAGKSGRICWHLAAVWSRRLGKEMIVRGAKGVAA